MPQAVEAAFPEAFPQATPAFRPAKARLIRLRVESEKKVMSDLKALRVTFCSRLRSPGTAVAVKQCSTHRIT